MFKLLMMMLCLTNITMMDAKPVICVITIEEDLRRLAAKDFADNEDKDIILEYIDMILADGILDNPKAYLEEWYHTRGWTKEFRIPEDYALSFFSKYLS